MELGREGEMMMMMMWCEVGEEVSLIDVCR